MIYSKKLSFHNTHILNEIRSISVKRSNLLAIQPMYIFSMRITSAFIFVKLFANWAYDFLF